MNRLLNYLLLFIVILIFAGLVIPFAILQVQVNSDLTGTTHDILNKILNLDLSFAPLKNALIAGILVPCLATICLGLQQYFYIKNLKNKMEYPVNKELIKQYQWIGISTGGLVALEILFFVCAFCVGTQWDVRKYLYIGGLVVTCLYGASIYIWATIVNIRISYDQAKQQSIVDAQNNDKTPPKANDDTNIEETFAFDDNNQPIINENQSVVNQDQGQHATSGNF